PADLHLHPRLPRRAADHRLADPDRGGLRGLEPVLRLDGRADGRGHAGGHAGARAGGSLAAAAAQPEPWSPGGLYDALVGPFVAFFRTHGKLALLMLLAISLYRLPDFMLGPMANPFYNDLGIAKEAVGAVRGSVGLVATILGVAAAGLSAVRFGFMPTLLAGAVLGPGS